MPRIRTIKPEFCTSEQVADCSTTARLLFVLMWCFCDDAGRHPANCKRLKMECFPGDSFTDSDIRAMIDELRSAGLVVEYECENAVFWQVTGWKHQRIDKPSCKYPPLDKNTIPRTLDDHSVTIRRPFGDSSPPERKGMEGNGKEGSGVEKDGGIVEESTTPQAVTHEPMTGFEFPIVGKGGPIWCLPQSKFAEYVESFPDLDVNAELRNARQFVRDNPTKRKTATGMTKFLGGWLSRSQNNPRCRAASKSTQMEILL